MRSKCLVSRSNSRRSCTVEENSACNFLTATFFWSGIHDDFMMNANPFDGDQTSFLAKTVFRPTQGVKLTFTADSQKWTGNWDIKSEEGMVFFPSPPPTLLSTGLPFPPAACEEVPFFRFLPILRLRRDLFVVNCMVMFLFSIKGQMDATGVFYYVKLHYVTSPSSSSHARMTLHFNWRTKICDEVKY